MENMIFTLIDDLCYDEEYEEVVTLLQVIMEGNHNYDTFQLVEIKKIIDPWKNCIENHKPYTEYVRDWLLENTEYKMHKINELLYDKV